MTTVRDRYAIRQNASDIYTRIMLTSRTLVGSLGSPRSVFASTTLGPFLCQTGLFEVLAGDFKYATCAAGMLPPINDMNLLLRYSFKNPQDFEPLMAATRASSSAGSWRFFDELLPLMDFLAPEEEAADNV